MSATQIILIVFIVALIIIYPIMIVSRNKKENQRMQEQTNSLKRGDKVLTTSGVYGTIIDLHLENAKTIVTIETGTEKNRGYLSVDSYAIYTVLKDEVTAEENQEVQSQNEKIQTKSTDENNQKKENVDEAEIKETKKTDKKEKKN